MTVVWLVENSLWRFSNDVIYNQKKEQAKRILCDVYGYEDIYEFFPPEVNQENLNTFLRTVFNHHEKENLEDKK